MAYTHFHPSICPMWWLLCRLSPQHRENYSPRFEIHSLCLVTNDRLPGNATQEMKLEDKRKSISECMRIDWSCVSIPHLMVYFWDPVDPIRGRLNSCNSHRPHRHTFDIVRWNFSTDNRQCYFYQNPIWAHREWWICGRLNWPLDQAGSEALAWEVILLKNHCPSPSNHHRIFRWYRRNSQRYRWPSCRLCHTG